MPITAYKSAGNYIITLEIPDSAQHNLDRKDVVDRNHAKFRTDSAIPVKIVHKFTGVLINTIRSDYDENFIYKVGEIIKTDYDRDKDQVCTKGIHFYLSEEAAYYHNKKDGLCKIWRDNGKLNYEIIYENNQLHGLYKTWYSNGQLEFEVTYKNGELHGPYKEWYDNGQLKSEGIYENGKLHGPCKLWYDDGRLSSEEMFENGELHGPCKLWYDDGQLESEEMWENGELRGLYKARNDNGQLCTKSARNTIIIVN